VFKSAVWGVPVGIFWHVNELSAHQVQVMVDALKQSGAMLMTNTQLVNYLIATQQNSGTTYYADSVTGMPVDVRPTGGSPVANAGAALTSEFKYDLMGDDQTLFGSSWEMGAYTLVAEAPGNAK
jgi:hypothetical protein